MKTVLLIFPEIYNSKSEIRYPPFGLLDIASYLRRLNISVHIFDRNLEGNSLDELKIKLEEREYDFIGISSLFIQKDDANHILDMLKNEKKSKIVLGGDYFVTYKDIYSNLADFVVCGDGELFFEQLVNGTIKDGGIYYPEGLDSLDDIPIPDKELLEQVAWDKRIFSLKTSRGCPFKCLFCSSINNNKIVRYHSSQYILDYISFIYNTYGISKFRFMDDVFTLNKGRVLSFCEKLVKSKMPVEISECFSHISVCDMEIFEHMKWAKFNSVQVGIESANNKVLQTIGKNITREAIVKTVNLIVACGLKVEGLYMLGNIGDTAETIKETIEFAKNLPTYKDWFSFACPLPNSKFYELAQQEGTFIEKDFNLYTNANIVYIPKNMTFTELEELMISARKMVKEKIIMNIKNKMFN